LRAEGTFMDKQAIQHVLDRYYTVLNSHDRDGIAEVVSAEVVFDDDMVQPTHARRAGWSSSTVGVAVEKSANLRTEPTQSALRC
jgi:hypothetical protein